MSEPNIVHAPSQFETSHARPRIVLLGASNLSMSLPSVINIARAAWREPLECVAAMGFGRSYGQQSKFFGKKFSGILQCGIWDALQRAQRSPTYALLGDVGNDLAYEAPIDTIVGWVCETMDRLARYDAAMVLNNLPIESLRRVGAVRYSVMRSALFPGCSLPRAELLRRAEALSAALDQIATERQIPVFSGEKQWYGWDPIHPRRASASAIWTRMMQAIAPQRDGLEPPPTSGHDARLLRQAQARSWALSAPKKPVSRSSARLADGTTIALF